MAYSLTPVARGAEAEIYVLDLVNRKIVIKKRVSKPYRTPEFNRVFITSRTRTEAKILTELYSAGLSVPAVIFVDEEEGVLGLEYVEGVRLSDIIETLSIDDVKRVSSGIGYFAGKMHSRGIYHGDFTLANVILSGGKLVVIDFGLAGYSNDIEEYAIDLHLMLRSVHAIRPEVTHIFESEMVSAYLESYQGNGKEVIKRMREIRTRGRYVDKELRRAVIRGRYIG